MKIAFTNHIFIAVLVLIVSGCASEVPLGSSVNLVKTQQIFNPDAAAQNTGYVPQASGERMQSTLEIYHTQTSSSKNNSGVSATTILAVPVPGGSK